MLSHHLHKRNLRLVAITPVELNLKIWLCVAFEEVDQHRGDFMHLAFFYSDERNFSEEPNLEQIAARVFRNRDQVLLRIHSECILGEAFGSTMCDCADQMSLSLKEMERAGSGLFVYLRQEGRGIGLRNKLGALGLQYGYRSGHKIDRRYSSDEANVALGHGIDERCFKAAAGFVAALGLNSVRLITGNPTKIGALAEMGLRISETVDLHSGCLSARARSELEEKIARNYIYTRDGLPKAKAS